jgi:sec-independent protein translocase protein TatC
MTDSEELLSTAATPIPRRALLPSPADGDIAPPIRPSGPSPAPAGEDKVMSLVDHLSELRRRVFISVLAVLVGTALGFAAAPSIITLLADQIPNTDALFFTQLGGAFFVTLRIAVIVGVAVASPIVLYELWAFISPGLTPHERRAARPWVPMAILFFLLGVSVAYVTLPYAATFLLGFQSQDLRPLITAENYFAFVTTLFVAFGAVMEFPIALVLLSKLGILSVERLQASRRYVMLAIVLFSVVITPGGDPVSPMIMSGVMYVLYELTIQLLKRAGQKDTRPGPPEAGR